jgi:hypothetical protein
MSKPIIITEELRQEAKDEFAALLDGLKMSNGEINYSKSFKYKDAPAVLWLSPLAYSKTMALVNSFSDEVAWHGTVTRKAANEFVIEDVFVYPQEVTGTTVNTDQERYTEWLYEFDDETFNKIRMQGHSHVNMAVSPSGVDSGHREKILGQLESDMFYIFMIWNKRLDTHTLIYDMANNVMYGDVDITVKLMGDASLDDFLADAKSKVQKKKAPVYKLRGKKPKGEADTDDEPRLPLWNRVYSCGGYGLYDHYNL